MEPRVAFSLLFNSNFSLEIVYLKIGNNSWKSTLLFRVCGALTFILETPRDFYYPHP